jgi:hypothetical protein
MKSFLKRMTLMKLMKGSRNIRSLKAKSSKREGKILSQIKLQARRILLC